MEQTVIYNLHTKQYSTFYKEKSATSLDKLGLVKKYKPALEIECFSVLHKEQKSLLDFIDYCKKESIKINALIYVDSDNNTSLNDATTSIKNLQKYNIPVKIKIDNIYYAEPNDYLDSMHSIKAIVHKINSFTYNNKPLSVFEKYVLAFYFTANRVYNMSPNFMDNSMRHFVGAQTSNYIICSGFSSLLTKMCNELFKKSELICFRQSSDVFNKEGTLLGSHANNLVLINDPKYKLHGIYHTDACWCSPKQLIPNPFNAKTNLGYLLMPLSTLIESNKYDFEFKDNLFLYEHIGAKITPFASSIGLSYKDTIEEYTLDYFGFKNTKTLLKEKPEQAFKLEQNKELNIIYKNAISRLQNDLGKSRVTSILKSPAPAILSMSLFAGYNEYINKFLDNLSKLVNNKKYNVPFVKKVLESSTLIDLTKKIKDIDTSLNQATTFSNLLKGVCSTHFIAPPTSTINKSYKEYILSLKQEEITKFLKINKSIINPKPISVAKLKTPLKILATFLQIDKNKIPEFVEKHTNFLSTLSKTEFVGIFDKPNTP